MITTRIRRLFQSEEAATATEYAVMLALIIVVVIIAITSVGNSTGGIWQSDVKQIITSISGS